MHIVRRIIGYVTLRSFAIEWGDTKYTYIHRAPLPAPLQLHTKHTHIYLTLFYIRTTVGTLSHPFDNIRFLCSPFALYQIAFQLYVNIRLANKFRLYEFYFLNSPRGRSTIYKYFSSLIVCARALRKRYIRK